MKNEEIKVVGGFGNKCNKGTQWHNQNRVYDNKVATCIPTSFQPYYLDNERERESDKVEKKLIIRKLTPLETCKLMGFEKADFQAMRDIKMTDAAIWHCCGDSIVTTCLMAIFGQMLLTEEETQKKVNDYVERLVQE